MSARIVRMNQIRLVGSPAHQLERRDRHIKAPFFGGAPQRTTWARQQMAGVPGISKSLEQHQDLSLASAHFPARVYLYNAQTTLFGRAPSGALSNTW